MPREYKPGPRSRYHRPACPRPGGVNTRCFTCRHPERPRIEALLAGGSSLESVATRFGLNKSSIWKHWTNHVPDEVKQGLKIGPAQLYKLADQAAAENMSIMDYLCILRTRLMRQLDYASRDGDTSGVNKTCSTMLSVLVEIGRLTGEIQHATRALIINNSVSSNSQTAIVAAPKITLNDPLVVDLQKTILGALAKHPEARADVIAALRAVERRFSAPAPNGLDHMQIEGVVSNG